MNEGQARRICEKRGLKLEPRGGAWRIHGPGVDLRFADFHWLRDDDLEPLPERPVWRKR